MAAERGRSRVGSGFVASIEKRGRFAVAVPLFERAGQVPLDRKERVTEGEIIWAEPKGGRARLRRRLGDVTVARDVSEALAMERLGGRGFPERVEEQARATVGAGPDHSIPRTDLTRMPTFTVDPSTARDFDDAVSAERKGDSVRLLVHIADVAAWVAPGSDLDQEALRRGNSVYIPTSVEPMLPHELSSGECSLAPGEERLAVTTEMIVSGSGEVEEASFYRSRVRSDARLDYDQLDRIFAGSEVPPADVAEAIALARGVAALLAERRGGHRLEVGSAEPSFEFDSEGNVVRASAYRETEAHRLIEHLMILVNEQVASLLERASSPGIFRVHQQPDPERIERLFGQLASLDLPTPAMVDGAGPTEAGRLAVEASRKVATEAARRGHGAVPWGSLVLRSLKPARYLEENLGHAGLGSDAYAHFTSPIRRYPDLFVHRSLLALTGGGETSPDRALASEVALHCSETEREAMLIERDADDICAAFLLERELFEGGWGHEFEGEVSGLIGAGAFISFGGRLGDVYEGFVPVRRFGGERFTLNEQETALVGSKTGRAVRFGDPVSVTVSRVQPTLGRVDLLFAGQ